MRSRRRREEMKWRRLCCGETVPRLQQLGVMSLFAPPPPHRHTNPHTMLIPSVRQLSVSVTVDITTRPAEPDSCANFVETPGTFKNWRLTTSDPPAYSFCVHTFVDALFEMDSPNQRTPLRASRAPTPVSQRCLAAVTF